MRRVVVTGMGIVSSIGNNTQEVTASLHDAKSGITAASVYRDMGFRSQVEGSVKIDLDALIDRRARRFMGDTAAYAWLAMDQALRDSGLEEKDIVNERTGLIVGSGGPSTRTLIAAADTAQFQSQARRPLRRTQMHVVHLLGGALNLVQDQGRQLFDQLGLRHQRPLHRQRGRTDPMGQAGRDVRRRRRGTRLDAVGAVRRDGRDVVEIQRNA